ncbi:MAG TPA: polymer-forming cytoskeletal protein [Candidatus Sulfotelmatobacter sp.]|nr:polymer-forming cytoskeletal protein [Candidatus Sulfotelmatobacter sp.]
MGFSSLWWLIRFSLVSVLAASAVAQGSHDRTEVGHDITIGVDQTASEATCFGCSVRVRGHVDGDVTTFGGSIVIERDGLVGGDATVFGGDLRLDADAKVKDVTVFGGRVRRDPQAVVDGDTTTFAGGAALWLFILFGLPFLFLGAIIAFVIWLIRRFKRPTLPIAARV